MKTEIRELYKGIDSWEGEIIHGEVKFKIEASQSMWRGKDYWFVEVLEPKGGVWVKPHDCGKYPTLEDAIRAAENFVRSK